MSDVEAGVEISVSGAEALADAAEQAQRLADMLQQAQDAADALASGSGGIDEVAEAIANANEMAQDMAEDLAAARDRAVEIGDGAGPIGAVGAALDDTGASAEALAEAEASARDNLAELNAEGAAAGDAAPGLAADAEAAEDYAAAAGHARDNLAEMGAAADAAGASSQLDAMDELAVQLAANLATSTGEGQDLWNTLVQIRDEMVDMKAGDELTIFSSTVPGSGKFGIKPPAEELEDELGNVFKSANIGPSAGDIERQMEAIEREMGTFETSAATYLHSVQDIESAMSSATLTGDEAAAALGSGGLGGSLDDMSGSLNDAWGAVSQLEGSLFLGENAISTFDQGVDGGVVSLGVLARSMEDAETSLGGEGGGGGLSGALGTVADGFASLGSGLSDIDIPDWLKTGAKWTGIATLIGGAVSVLDPLVAGTVAFGVMGAPALYKVYEGWEAVSAAQKAYNAAAAKEKSDPTAANLAAQKKALTALDAAWKTVPKDVQPAIKSIQGLETAFEQASKKSGIGQDMLGDIPRAVNDIKGAIPALSSLGKSFAPELSKMFGDISRWEGSPAFEKFIRNLNADMPSAAHAVRQVADAIGGIMNSLAKPANEKDFASMFTGLSAGLKAVTPGAVHELGQVAVDIGKMGTEIQKLQGGKVGNFLGKAFDDLMEVPVQISKGFGAIGKFTEYMSQAVGKSPAQDSRLWDKIFGGGSAAAAKYGKQDGSDYEDGVKSSVKDLNLSSLLGTSAAAKASAKLKVPAEVDPAQLQKSATSAAKDVRLRGVKVDLSDAKLSGLTQLDSVLTKAAGTAGKDYDTALGTAISSGSDADTSAAKKLETGVVQAMSDLRAQMEQIGEAAAEGLAAGIRAGMPQAVAAADQLANAVETAAKSALQSHSPSLVFKDIGGDIDTGLADGITGGKAGPVSAMTSLMDQLVAQAKAGGKTLEATIKADIATAESVAKSTESAASSYASLSSIESAGIGSKKADEYPNLQTGMEAKLLGMQHFYSQLKKLKKEGLSEALIKQIAEAGPQEGQQEAAQLLKSGKSGIRQADKIEAAIEKWTRYLGREAGNAATEPYKDIGKPIASALKSALHDVEVTGDIKLDLGNVNIKVELDGKTIANQVQKLTLQRANRNTSAGLKLSTRGA